MMKIVWLTQYNVFKLLPEIKLNRQVTQHSASWIDTLSKELVLQKDIDLHIITYTHLSAGSQTIKKNGITFHVIKYSFPFTNKGFPWYLPIDKLTGYYSFASAAGKVIKQIQPDVLHVHGTEGGYFLPAYRNNIPSVISIQGIISELLKISPNHNELLQKYYEDFAIRKGKYFGCRTNFDAGYVKNNNKKARIFDLPEAMNYVFFEQTWKPEPGVSLLFVGSVIKRKGIEDLIHAMHKLKKFFPDIQLRVIGSANKEYIDFLNQMISEYKLSSNISWLGNKAPAEIAAELSRSTFFVLPSFLDNSPNSLAEAMAVGVPSIATKVGGIPSMITNGVDGMLFEKNDVNGLVNIIQSLVRNPQLQDSLSRNARTKAFERNYPARVVGKYVEVYKELANISGRSN